MSAQTLLNSSGQIDYGVPKGALLYTSMIQTAGGATGEVITLDGAGGAGHSTVAFPGALTASMTYVLTPVSAVSAFTSLSMAFTSASTATITAVGANLPAGYYRVCVYA